MAAKSPSSSLRGATPSAWRSSLNHRVDANDSLDFIQDVIESLEPTP
jgi:hypothetical protein